MRPQTRNSRAVRELQPPDVEASALRHPAALRGPTPLLRLQSDERLIALVRRGNHAAFEALVGRYQSRLLAFCRHMLGSREDAEDVLQEVFAAAFNAILADERAINVRPWLYRIARNRSLNHLRRQQAIGVDSMDVHLSEGGLTTADKVHKREEFRALIGDVQELPETQKTALLLREIDALSYEQIAEAMETTVPSVKSLLVRARVSLAEMSEARQLTCEEVREELGEVAEGLARTSAPVRRHLRTCDRCAKFRKQLKQTNKALASLMPVAPLLLFKKVLLAHLGTTASAGGAAATGAAGGAAAGGAVGAGISTVASKAAAGLAAAAIVSVGAVEVKRAQLPVEHPPAHAAIAPVRPAPAAAPAPIAADLAPVTSLADAGRDAAPGADEDDAKGKDKDDAPTATEADAKAAAERAAADEKATAAKGAGAAVAPMPSGPTQQGVDTVVLPGQQPGQGTGGTPAPTEPQAHPASQPLAPQPAPQPQPQPQPEPQQPAQQQPAPQQPAKPVVTTPVTPPVTVPVPVPVPEPIEDPVDDVLDGPAAPDTTSP
jgi:RNA polymerase sigma factor (sigma-70 family)